jgi:hypothetical protein
MVMVFYNISSCARCGKDHHNLAFYTFTRPIADTDGTVWNQWGICPDTAEPILLKDAPAPVLKSEYLTRITSDYRIRYPNAKIKHERPTTVNAMRVFRILSVLAETCITWNMMDNSIEPMSGYDNLPSDLELPHDLKILAADEIIDVEIENENGKLVLIFSSKDCTDELVSVINDL